MPIHNMFADELARAQRVALRAFLLGTVTLGACHRVNLSPEEDSVRVLRDPNQVTRCRFVKEVSSSDRLTGGIVNREKAEENAYKILKQKTARLGANTVLVDRSYSGMAGTAMKGKAFACHGT